MEPSWKALLPFLIVIPLSIWTKQVIPGLFVALLLGSYLIEPSLLGGIKTMLSYTVDNVMQTNNIRIIIFLYVFAGLISMIKYTGGIKGFVHLVGKKVKTARSALLLTWISTMVTFSDPDFRIVTIAPIMKALKKRLHLSSQQIGFTIEVTSNPVVALIPLATAFVGYMVSVIDKALKTAGIDAKAYTVYVKSIPFNFFSFTIIIVGLYYSFFKYSKKAKASKERARAAAGIRRWNQQEAVEFASEESTNPNEEQGEEGLESCPRAFEKDTPVRPWNLIIPLSIVLVLTLFLSWWDGHRGAKNFFDAFLRSDALGVMLESLMITMIITVIYFLFQKFKLADLLTHFVKGGNELMSVILMLALIWAVSAVSEDLGFSEYITDHVKGWIPHYFVAPVLFLLGAVISYFVGSSWGTWGLLMPLGVTLAHQSGTNILLVIGAVFASGTFGAFASPLSDNTVTLCTILDLPVMEYSRTKLIPAFIAAGLAAVLFGVMSFVMR
ncbi:Na+/H+ antiporter NhaC family protein [Thermaerobacillus caldiproteolyticus]|uniref:Na+/H+ antiporter NhaC n=1 Tax=Thermaerobacillus caldiproteolyticus TaxID=247480 RepID=A0A7V9Z8F3_9BACL|nr:Na+/H+ antiporter NhaC family protein [Anoxybacillus caldiproteolyticus]MBA2875960.1 Na+/H+ antiporter NhaC [Anoxybacillus caldiproteolyticus]QPA32405.1 sodium:proton antiporter [Anoxybacillus caldiproteolyticus]